MRNQQVFLILLIAFLLVANLICTFARSLHKEGSRWSSIFDSTCVVDLSDLKPPLIRLLPWQSSRYNKHCTCWPIHRPVANWTFPSRVPLKFIDSKSESLLDANCVSTKFEEKRSSNSFRLRLIITFWSLFLLVSFKRFDSFRSLPFISSSDELMSLLPAAIRHLDLFCFRFTSSLVSRQLVIDKEPDWFVSLPQLSSASSIRAKLCSFSENEPEVTSSTVGFRDLASGFKQMGDASCCCFVCLCSSLSDLTLWLGDKCWLVMVGVTCVPEVSRLLMPLEVQVVGDGWVLAAATCNAVWRLLNVVNGAVVKENAEVVHFLLFKELVCVGGFGSGRLSKCDCLLNFGTLIRQWAPEVGDFFWPLTLAFVTIGRWVLDKFFAVNGNNSSGQTRSLQFFMAAS